MYVECHPGLSLRTFFKPPKADLEQLFGTRRWFYRYGRDALAIALRVLGLKPGDEILAPSSLCEVVIAVFAQHGIGIEYYSLNRRLGYDISEIEYRIKPKIKAVVAVHFFGFPGNILALEKLCQQRGLKLIEDCAYVFNGSIAGRMLGSIGDAAIFSPRKLLPIGSGGALRLNRPELPDPSFPDAFQCHGMILKSVLSLFIANAASWSPLPLVRFRRLRGYVEEQIEWREEMSKVEIRPPQAMPFLSEFLLRRADPDEVIARRRKIFRFWLDRFSEINNVEALFPELPDGVCPYCFPIIVENKNGFIHAMAANNVLIEATLNYTYRSPQNIRNPDEPFPTTDALVKRIVYLPVHQNLRASELNKAAERLSLVALNESLR